MQCLWVKLTDTVNLQLLDSLPSGEGCALVMEYLDLSSCCDDAALGRDLAR